MKKLLAILLIASWGSRPSELPTTMRGWMAA